LPFGHVQQLSTEIKEKIRNSWKQYYMKDGSCRSLEEGNGKERKETNGGHFVVEKNLCHFVVEKNLCHFVVEQSLALKV